MDDCSSWLLFHGHGDGGTDSENSYGGSPGVLHEEQSLQLQQQLHQIYMMLDSEEDGYTDEAVPTSSSSTFGSFSGSPNENSSLMTMLAGSTTTPTTSCHEPAVDVSSLQIPLSPAAYHDDHNHADLFNDNHETFLDLDELMTQEPHQEQQAQSKQYGRHEFGGAFRPYVRHLSPRKKPKPGASGQRAIKDVISALARIHMAKLAQWQSIRMEMAAPPSFESRSNDNQIQHVLSERKRREKLNNSLKALRAVLPPGPKKDRASTLFRARDYVNTLKARVSELEEKNRMLLVASQLHDDNSGEQNSYSGEQVEADISNNADAEETSEEFRLKIVGGSEWSAMDAVVSILQCLKEREIGDVRLVAMDTSSTSSGSPGKDFQIATVTLQVMSSRCGENCLLKESVIKIVKDAMKSEMIVTT